MKRIARRVVNSAIETKMIEASLGPFGSVTTTPSTGFFAPAAGTARDQRVGRVITPTYFKLRGLLHGAQSNVAVDDSHNIFRILLLVTDYDWTYGTSIATNNYIDPGKGVHHKIKQVLYDRTMSLCSPGRDSTGYLAVQKEINIKASLRRMGKMVWDDSGNPSKLLYLVMVSDSVISVNPGFTDGQYRFYYKDG
ncbi:putative capsid protein [Dragonfly larvae associated circular virus-8]|uniref:putative capsid protein n=1 Tax=Dragonfly larvae associated circular virus-8 TaxID=1454029 RepID=UPI0003E80E31|nr:putative capsid protein [Dragonfly larvae associated circular virus-8]AHH31478.1 putative capsid protein [Dragonfly larvae associated circular virus-8]